MKTRHHYPILLIALLLGLMGFAERAQADYTLGHYTRVEADMNTIKLEWTKTTGSQGTMSLQFRYRVRWRKSTSGRWEKEYEPTTKLQCEIPDLKFGTTYEIEVISEAVYGTGGGSYGVRKVSTIADKEEPKPGGYVDGYPKAVSPTEIEVKWNLATDNITKQKDLVYMVHWTKSGSPWDVGGRYDVGGEGTFLRITDLEPNTEYLVNVVVEDKARNQARYGKHTIKTPPAADTEKPKPGGYVDGYPKAISPTSIVVKWNKATDNVTKQEKLRYQVRCGLFKKLVKSSPILTDETEYTITDLPYSDITYDISVKVWDEADNVTFYSVKEVKPLEKEPKPTVQVSSVMLDQPKVTIDGDRESFRLEATVLPANATNPALQWSSSNESVATVEAVSLSSMLKSGTVEGSAVTVRIHKKGKAEITAQAMDGSGKTASCQVEVISTVGNETIDGLRVYAVDGALHLTLLAPQMVHLYDVSGALVRTIDAPAGDHVLPLAPGVYLVRIGEQIAKVLIK